MSRRQDLTQPAEPAERVVGGNRAAAPASPVPQLELFSASRRRTRLWMIGLAVLLVVSAVVAVGLGPVTIPPGTVVKIFTHHLFGWPTTVD